MTDGPIQRAIERFLIDDGWQFSRLGSDPIFELRFMGENGTWSCLAQAREDESQFVFYSLLPGDVDESQRQAMAELTARINYGLVLGNFELDMSTGDLRYKTSIDVEGAELVDALARQVVYANVMVTDRYLPAIAAVQSGAVDAVDALTLVED